MALQTEIHSPAVARFLEVNKVNLQYSLDPADPELVKPHEFQFAPPPEPAAGPPVDELYMSKNKKLNFKSKVVLAVAELTVGSILLCLLGRVVVAPLVRRRTLRLRRLVAPSLVVAGIWIAVAVVLLLGGRCTPSLVPAHHIRRHRAHHVHRRRVHLTVRSLHHSDGSGRSPVRAGRLIRILIHLVVGRAVARLRLFDLHLLAVERDVMLGRDAIHRGVVFERKEPEAAGLLLLLVVHDDHFHHLAVASEEHPQVGLGDVGWEAAEKDFREGPAAGLWLLQGSRVALLRIDGPARRREAEKVCVGLVADVIPYVFDFVRLTCRPSCAARTATRSARCWDQRRFCGSRVKYLLWFGSANSATHMNPKPRERPVSLFFITTQSMTSP